MKIVLKKNYKHETKITTYIKSVKTSLKPIKIKENWNEVFNLNTQQFLQVQ